MCFSVRGKCSESTAGSRNHLAANSRLLAGQQIKHGFRVLWWTRERTVDDAWEIVDAGNREHQTQVQSIRQDILRYLAGYSVSAPIGARCWRQRWTVTASLYYTLWGTVSQCRLSPLTSSHFSWLADADICWITLSGFNASKAHPGCGDI